MRKINKKIKQLPSKKKIEQSSTGSKIDKTIEQLPSEMKIDKKINQLSPERKIYLKKIKLRKIKVLLTQLAILVALIALWEIMANLGKIDSFITSQPSRILKTFANLSSNNLIEHLKITCVETLVGFFAGSIAGTIIAMILWWFPFISKVCEPFLVVLNSLPKTALGPIIIIWVGAGTPAIIVMALAISLVVTILNILNGFLETDKEKIKMARTFKARRSQILTKIIIPANLQTFFNTLKVNIGLSLVGVITGEFLVSKGGLRILNCIWRSGVSTRFGNDECYYISNRCSYYV